MHTKSSKSRKNSQSKKTGASTGYKSKRSKKYQSRDPLAALMRGGQRR